MTLSPQTLLDRLLELKESDAAFAYRNIYIDRPDVNLKIVDVSLNGIGDLRVTVEHDGLLLDRAMEQKLEDFERIREGSHDACYHDVDRNRSPKKLESLNDTSRSYVTTIDCSGDELNDKFSDLNRAYGNNNKHPEDDGS